MNCLFVYGTLRLGCRNEYALRLSSTARYCGKARVAGRLFKVAHYPALAIPLRESDWVIGDLFENVPDELLSQLDQYEGAEYTRQLVSVNLEHGGLTSAFTYMYCLSLEGLEYLPSGDWKLVTLESFEPE